MKGGKGVELNGELVNRTGVALAPELAAELIEAADGTPMIVEGDRHTLGSVRASYVPTAGPIGSPPPGVDGNPPTRPIALLVDKLGERLAFERSGVRLYDALLSKFDAYGTWEGGPSRAELEEIQADELAHAWLVKEALVLVGGDPMAVTPSANVHAVASKGIPAVLTDPRTDLRQGLEAILMVELVDNDCWETLIDLGAAVGVREIGEPFRQALEEEREHLAKVRLWLAAGVSGAATGTLASSFAARAAARAAGAEAITKAEGGVDTDALDGARPSRAGGAAAKPRPKASRTTTQGAKRAPGTGARKNKVGAGAQGRGGTAADGRSAGAASGRARATDKARGGAGRGKTQARGAAPVKAGARVSGKGKSASSTGKSASSAGKSKKKKGSGSSAGRRSSSR